MLSPIPQSPQDAKAEEDTLLSEKVDLETDYAFTQKTTDLKDRRKAALDAATAAINAEYDVIEQEEFALLREVDLLKRLNQL